MGEMITIDKERFPDIMFSEELLKKNQNLPSAPGVYLHKNCKDKVIYVGKAKNLRNRVRSYFRDFHSKDPKTLHLIKQIIDTEIILVDNETEAFILEDTLIKKYRPKYNVMLRDDKTYPYIRITNEEFPQVVTTRKVIRDGSKYFGPYTNVGQMNRTLKILREVFKIRSCKTNLITANIQAKKHKICLDYQIKKCNGICEGKETKEQYLENIRLVKTLLTGRNNEVMKLLKEKMQDYSKKMEYEEAGKIKNSLITLNEYSNKQKVVTSDLVDRDIFGLVVDGNLACAIILKVREGRLIGRQHYIVKNADRQSPEKIIQRTIESQYLDGDFIPQNIFLAYEPDDLEYLTDWLSQKSEKSIHIHIPKIGDKKKTVEMANINAEYILKEYKLAISKREQAIPRSVVSLKRDLRLKNMPHRIECFDNSHIQGSELVSSMVVFIDGKPKKSEYRKFKIKTVHKNDDFAAMRETVKRRYTRVKEELKEADYPDLVIVDGGKGQLSSAVSILKDLGLFEKIPVIGLAKRLEEVFIPHTSEPLNIPKTSSSLKLIQQLRDEAHRFAITYHRSLRMKRTLKSGLTDIEGIGEKTSQKLLIAFGSIDNIKEASIGELTEVVNFKIANAIKSNTLKKKAEDDGIIKK